MKSESRRSMIAAAACRRLLCGALGLLVFTSALIGSGVVSPVAAQISGPLRVNPANPSYFTDNSGKSILLAGSHTWANMVDNGFLDPPTPFDYAGYLDFLQTNNHNFFRLYAQEQAKWNNFTSSPYYYGQSPYQRPGPDLAPDGKPKFDLNAFDQTYFDRLRQRVIDAGSRGIYVSVMLFNGWSAESKGQSGNPWLGHPFNAANNINGVNGDLNGDGSGPEVHTMADAGLVALQEAYVRKVIDTVNDLDNVLYEICNECGTDSLAWETHMVAFVKAYEAGLAKQHPAGMTVEYPGGSNSDLFASNADWISPNDSGGYTDNPPAADGTKVVIADTDHIYGIGGDRTWVWKSVTRGLHLLFMDGVGSDDYVTIASPGWNLTDPVWVSLRANMGYARSYTQRMDLTATRPRGDLTSAEYALASPTSSTPEYLVYFIGDTSSFNVNLSSNLGPFAVEWLNPATGAKTAGADVVGGAVRSFTPPFSGDAVLYLKLASAPDTQNPTIAITTPTGASTFLTNTSPLITLAGTAADNAAVTQVTWLNSAGGFGTASGTTTWSVPSITLQPGANVIVVTAADAANNTATAILTVTYDATAPDTTITASPPAVTNSTGASFSFTSTEAGSTFECKLDSGSFVACTSPQSYNALAAGSHTFQVRAIDPAGNVDPTPASFTWTIDTTAPDTTITTNPPALSKSHVGEFTFTSTEAGSTFECTLDGSPWASCTSPKTYIALNSGSHTFQVRATDPAGNTDPTPASYTWFVDMTAPDTTITASPPALTNSTSASFSFTATEAGSTFECALDAAAFAACTSPKIYSPLADGGHTFQVRATDPAGNTDATPASFTWTVDTTAPDTTITSNPAAVTSSTSASFSFTATEAGSTFQCKLDGTAFGACTSPQSYSLLSEGSHTFQVRATDAAGNTDATPASFTWIVDLTNPTVAIDSPTATGVYATTNTLLSLAGIAADNVGLTQVTWVNDRGGSGTASGTTSWAVSNVVLQFGTNVITVAAQDVTGHIKTAVLTVTLSAPTVFTDAPLVAQSTPVKTVHILELRTAIDSARVAHQLQPFNWTDAVLTPGVSQVAATHLVQLRSALNDAYLAANRQAPIYSNQIVGSGVTIIQAIDISELQSAVLALQ